MNEERRGKDAEDGKKLYLLEESEKDVTYTHLFSFLKIINRFFPSCFLMSIKQNF
jgi:hypothetical protein